MDNGIPDDEKKRKKKYALEFGKKLDTYAKLLRDKYFLQVKPKFNDPKGIQAELDITRGLYRKEKYIKHAHSSNLRVQFLLAILSLKSKPPRFSQQEQTGFKKKISVITRPYILRSFSVVLATLLLFTILLSYLVSQFYDFRSQRTSFQWERKMICYTWALTTYNAFVQQSAECRHPSFTKKRNHCQSNAH